MGDNDFFEKGNYYWELGYFQQAIIYFTKAIELDEDNAGAFNNRAILYGELKQYTNAISDFTQAIKLDKDDATAYCLRGFLYGELKQYTNAISDFTKAIELDEDNAAAYNSRGLSYKELKQYTNAIVDFTQAIKLDKDNAAAYNNRGVSYIELKQYTNAISDFTIAIELGENLSVVYNNRASLYGVLKQYTNALVDYTKALELNNTYELAYYGRSAAYYNLNQFQNSQKDLFAYMFIIRSFYINKIELKDWIFEVFEKHPQTIQYILDNFDIDTESLLFNKFESIIRKNDNLNLILNLIKKGTSVSIHTIRIESIFKYHMGGCLSSYDILDKCDQLTSNQEYYYWLQSSYEIQVNFKEDFESGIQHMLQNQNIDLDNYYLGLAYLLNEEEEKAIQFFNKSNQFLFSRILLAFFEVENAKKENLIFKLNQEIEDFKFDSLDADRKMNFDPYFYYFECKNYIEELKTFDGLKFETEFRTFQSIFKLNDAARSELDILNYSLDIKKGIEVLYQEFDNQFDPSLNLDQAKIKLSKTKEKFKDIFDKIERNIGEGNDAENELRTVIESFAVTSTKFYSLLITYYYSLDKIDKTQAFYLTLFLVKIDTDFKDKKLGDAMTETYKTGLDTGKTITGNLALKIILGLIKSGAPKIFEFLKEDDAFDKSGSQYYPFKENIIDYFKAEKANLSSKKFENKFKLINYFVDIAKL
jgi:tetratricopeptide (TPR) repeat protein